jgi:hypothetical protein
VRSISYYYIIIIVKQKTYCSEGSRVIPTRPSDEISLKEKVGFENEGAI